MERSLGLKKFKELCHKCEIRRKMEYTVSNLQFYFLLKMRHASTHFNDTIHFLNCVSFINISLVIFAPTGWLSGERVGLMTWWFDPGLRQTFFPAYFNLLPLQKHVRKVVGGFGKISCVSTGVRKPGNTCASPTAMI